MEGPLDSRSSVAFDMHDTASAPFGPADVACVYQPIIRLDDGAVVSAEILARRRDQHGVLQGAAQFANALYEGEPARRLTGFMVQAVLDDVIAGRLSGLPFLFMLNLPLHILLDPTLPLWIDHALATANIPRDRLGFELTETRPVQDFTEAARAITKLRAQGHRIALDDISGATANLDRLFELDFSSVKLDCSVIAALVHSQDANDFVRDTVARCAATGKQLIAEGAEDCDTLHRLHALGVGYAQGFVIAHPLSAPALCEWFTQWRNNAVLSYLG